MYLSKSDFKVARTWPTKLYYKKRGYPSLMDDDEYLALLAEGGFMVQKIATLLYSEGREMPFDAAPASAAAETLRALQAQNATLFEATFISNGKLARFEVEFTGDVGELRREHFLTLVPVDAEVEMLSEEVAEAAADLAASLRPRLRKIPTLLSVVCRGCEYRATKAGKPDGFRECWGELADATPHLLDLYQVGNVGGRGGPVAEQLIREHKVKLYDIPRGGLVKADGSVGEINTRQLIQIDHTRENSEWVSEELPGILRSFRYPLHFIDFETTAVAIPYHSGMHPYEPVAFQWSCHTLGTPGATPRHAEWINVEDAFSNFEFAETLARHLGRDGTVFMWATHENTILRRILEQMPMRGYRNPALSQWLRWIIRDRGQRVGRLIDMNQPGGLPSWRIVARRTVGARRAGGGLGGAAVAPATGVGGKAVTLGEISVLNGDER